MRLPFLPDLFFLINLRNIKCYHQAKTVEPFFADFQSYLQICGWRTSIQEGNN